MLVSKWSPNFYIWKYYSNKGLDVFCYLIYDWTYIYHGRNFYRWEVHYSNPQSHCPSALGGFLQDFFSPKSPAGCRPWSTWSFFGLLYQIWSHFVDYVADGERQTWSRVHLHNFFPTFCWVGKTKIRVRDCHVGSVSNTIKYLLQVDVWTDLGLCSHGVAEIEETAAPRHTKLSEQWGCSMMLASQNSPKTVKQKPHPLHLRVPSKVWQSIVENIIRDQYSILSGLVAWI